jgi:hypothetical protein
MKRLLQSRPIRWSLCIALALSVDAMLNIRSNGRSVQAQEKKEAPKKKTADDLRKELEEKLKGIDINDPKFDELTKEYEKLIKDAIGQIPPPFQPNVPPQVIEIQRRMQLENPNIFFPEFGQLPPRGRLGVMVEGPSPELREQLDLPENQGQLIREVVRDSVAEKIGLKVNDIILEFNGKAVSAIPQEFVQMVRQHKPDAEATLVILRKGKKETIKGIKLPEVKAEMIQPRLELAAPNIQVIEIQVPLALPAPMLLPAPPMAIAAPAIEDDLIDSTIRINNNQFTVKAKQNNTRYDLNGSLKGQDKEIKSISITDGEKTTEYPSVDKVPEEHREFVKKLLKSIR